MLDGVATPSIKEDSPMTRSPPRAHFHGSYAQVLSLNRHVQALVMSRDGQNHIYTVYIRYFWLGNHQIYGVFIRIYTVLANPSDEKTGTMQTAR